VAGNYIRTKEIKEKNRKASLKAWKNADFREKQKENHPDFSGENNPFYGKKHSKEDRQRMSDNRKGSIPWNKGKINAYSEESLILISKSNKEYWASLSEEERKFTEEHKEKIRLANTGKKRTEEQNKKQSERMIGKKQPNISLALKGKPSKNKGKKNPKISEINKETWKNPETRQRRIEGIKKAWSNPDKKHQWVSAANKANSFHKINKIETKLDGILNTLFPNEYKYTGDGSIIIEGKIPDFININGQKKIIELFGNYWHKQEDEQIRKEYFDKYGYKTLIIWEEEMTNLENVKNKLVEFNFVEGGVV